MSDSFSRILALLKDVILPHLNSIQVSQTEQRLQSDRLHQSLEEFRVEMHMRLSSIHAEIAACRQEFEDTLITMREQDSLTPGERVHRKTRRSIH